MTLGMVSWLNHHCRYPREPQQYLSTPPDFVRLFTSANDGVLFRYDYSQVPLDPVWYYLLGSRLFSRLLYIKWMIDVKLNKQYYTAMFETN